MRPITERRKHRRLELQVPVLFTVQCKTGTGITRTGVTQDVSPGGILFRTDSAQDLQPQQELTVKLVIPRQSDPAEATVSLSGEARIVRAERLAPSPSAAPGGNQRWSVAAQFISRPSVDLSTINSLFAHP